MEESCSPRRVIFRARVLEPSLRQKSLIWTTTISSTCRWKTFWRRDAILNHILLKNILFKMDFCTTKLWFWNRFSFLDIDGQESDKSVFASQTFWISTADFGSNCKPLVEILKVKSVCEAENSVVRLVTIDNNANCANL